MLRKFSNIISSKFIRNEYFWSMQENELVNRLKNGDEEAYRIIFNDNQKKVINACYRLVNDIDTAEDLTQEVFIKVYSSISQFRGCLLYTSDAADERSSVDLGGRRIIKKKKK